MLSTDPLKIHKTNNIFIKTNTALTKPAADHEDINVRRTVRHVRTGSDGAKPTSNSIKSK